MQENFRMVRPLTDEEKELLKGRFNGRASMYTPYAQEIIDLLKAGEPARVEVPPSHSMCAYAFINGIRAGIRKLGGPRVSVNTIPGPNTENPFYIFSKQKPKN
jgi:hypothetical protein